MERIRATVLVLAATVLGVVGLAGPAAVQPEFVLQIDEFGPLLELIARLFDIDVRIRG